MTDTTTSAPRRRISSAENEKREPQTLYVAQPAEPTQPPLEPPPNGGRQAWLQVFGAFFLFFSSWGVIVAFGAYEDYLLAHELAAYSPSSVAWIGTVQGFLVVLVGVITGPLFDMGYLRHLIGAGLVLNVVSLMAASFAGQYYTIFLSLAICMGLGSGCLYVPSVAIIAQYFTTKRSVATGLAATGGSVGGVIFSITFRKLAVAFGWGWANRILAFLVLATLIIPLFILTPRIKPSKRRIMFDLSAFGEIPYILFSFGLFFVSVGLYTPSFFITTFAREKIVGTSTDLNFYLVALLNVGSFFGRLIPNMLADKFGPWQVLLPATLLASVFGFVWIGIKSMAGVIVLCIFYGFFSGAVISIPPSALVVISPNLEVVGTRMGMCFSFAGLGLLIGSPLAGSIIQTSAGYRGVAGYTGALVFVGFGFFVLAWRLHERKASKAALDMKLDLL